MKVIAHEKLCDTFFALLKEAISEQVYLLSDKPTTQVLTEETKGKTKQKMKK